MQKEVSHIIGIALGIVISLSSAHASPYRTNISGDTDGLRLIASEVKDGSHRRSNPLLSNLKKSIRLSAHIVGSGRYSIYLNKITFKSWDSSIQDYSGFSKKDDKDIALVEGYARSNGKKLSLGGSIYSKTKNGKPVLHLIMNASRGKGRALYLKSYISGHQLKDAKVSSVPTVALKELACGNDNHDNDHQTAAMEQQEQARSSSQMEPQAVASREISPSNPQYATIATEFDPQWYETYGANSNAQIATLVAAASAIYQNQLGIRLVISAQHGFSSSVGNPFNSTNSGTLLGSFKNYTLNNNQLGQADLYHLFSGKDFDGGVIGLAWVGVVCSNQDYSFGITQKFHPAADASIVAHEIGHNFGAGHDTTDGSSLMAPYINIPGSTYFSAASIADVVNHLNSSPSCFDVDNNPSDGVTPSPVPTVTPGPDNPNESAGSISLGASVSRSGSLTLKINVSEVQSGCEVVLYGAARRNGQGSEIYRFSPSNPTSIIRLAGLRDPRSRGSFLSFYGEYECELDSSGSLTKNVALDSISKKTSQSSKALLNAIKSAFSSLKKRSTRR
jgi:hypothetical protein